MHSDLASQPYSPLITLMTVDYLLTAKDLPGWPGKFPPIEFRSVLLKGMRELAHGLWGDERICRELKILNRIAEMHGLGEFFREKVRRSKRNMEKKGFEGSGIHPKFIFLDGRKYDINDIFDAAYAAKNIYQVYSDMKISSLAKIFAKSLMFYFHTLGKGKPFPPESEWGNNAYFNK
jgi:hypothetical protein